MTIETQYRVSKPGDGKRYVRYAGDGLYIWCETGRETPPGWRFDIAQGSCSVDDLPPDIAAAARARLGYYPSYVDWPL